MPGRRDDPAGHVLFIMFWKANKWGLIALAAGMAALVACYAFFMRQGDQDTAEKILSTGICVLLFAVAVGTWLSARKGGQ